jgi:hypothetical protein
MSNAIERVTRAVSALAVGEGRIRERLYEALKLLDPVDAEDLPDGDPRDRFERLRTNLGLDRRHGSGLTILATVERMKEPAAAEVARRILELGESLRGDAREHALSER